VRADESDPQLRFTLPPFAYWSPDKFAANAMAAKALIDARCGLESLDY
jgi:D-lyxose ketol-isomerase